MNGQMDTRPSDACLTDVTVNACGNTRTIVIHNIHHENIISASLSIIVKKSFGQLLIGESLSEPYIDHDTDPHVYMYVCM